MLSSRVYKCIELSFLQRMGLKVLTNSRVRKPQSCSVARLIVPGAVGAPGQPIPYGGKKKKLLLIMCHIQQ